MASFDSSGWPSGATVTVYARDAFGNATGSSVTSATASAAGVASFAGLADSGKYVATDGSRTVKFGTPPASASSGSRVRLPRLDAGGGGAYLSLETGGSYFSPAGVNQGPSDSSGGAIFDPAGFFGYNVGGNGQPGTRIVNT